MKQIATISLLFLALSGLSLSSSNLKNAESPPEAVALQFYNWYLKEIYPKTDISNPDIKLVKSAYRIVSEAQFDKLKKTGFFSNEFYKNQTIIYNACNVKLCKVNIQKVEQCGCSPTEFASGNECDFISYYPWVGGQGETINTAKIIKVKTRENLSKVTIGLSDYKIAYSFSEVTLLKEDSHWKISKIEIHF